MISLFSENVFVPRKFFEVVLYNVISKIGCKWLKQGKKLHLFLVLSLSAILHGYDAVLGGVHRKKSFHSLSLHSGALRVALLKCRLGCHQWEFAMIVLCCCCTGF